MNKTCLGCGVNLQSCDEKQLGYTKSMDMDYCMRCFRLTHYNEKTHVLVHNDINEILNVVNNKKGLVFYFVDYLNLCEETLNYYHSINGDKCLVVSKSDTIPKSVYLEKIKGWLKNNFQVKDSILFIRKNSKSSIKKIIDMMSNSNRSIFYFLGVTNAGKSTFINELLDYLEESNRHITVSEMPNTTVDFIEIKTSLGTIYDTAGLYYSYLVLPFTDVACANLKKEIKPITYQLKKGDGFIVEPLFRVEALTDTSITMFGSNDLKLTRVYQKSERLKNNPITIDIIKASNILVKGVCFFYIKNTSVINIYNVKKEYIEVMPSYMGENDD